MWKEPVAVGLGAAGGACARHLLVLAAPDGAAQTLVATLLINLAGCFAMGLFAPGKLWGTGFLGGLTTFSAVAVMSLPLGGAGAAALMSASFATCVAAWWAGDGVRRAHARRGANS